MARQWAEIPGLSDSAGLDFHERNEWRARGKELKKPDYQACITIATQSSLAQMVAPGALVICTPIIIGSLFGVEIGQARLTKHFEGFGPCGATVTASLNLGGLADMVGSLVEIVAFMQQLIANGKMQLGQ